MPRRELEPPTATATYTFTGRDQIQTRLQGLFETGLRLRPVGEGILVFQIGPEGTLEHQWMIGWVESS